MLSCNKLVALLKFCVSSKKLEQNESTGSAQHRDSAARSAASHLLRFHAELQDITNTSSARAIAAALFKPELCEVAEDGGTERSA